MVRGEVTGKQDVVDFLFLIKLRFEFKFCQMNESSCTKFSLLRKRPWWSLAV